MGGSSLSGGQVRVRLPLPSQNYVASREILDELMECLINEEVSVCQISVCLISVKHDIF